MTNGLTCHFDFVASKVIHSANISDAWRGLIDVHEYFSALHDCLEVTVPPFASLLEEAQAFAPQIQEAHCH